jgi:hypothetical protein
MQLVDCCASRKREKEEEEQQQRLLKANAVNMVNFERRPSPVWERATTRWVLTPYLPGYLPYKSGRPREIERPLRVKERASERETHCPAQLDACVHIVASIPPRFVWCVL